LAFRVPTMPWSLLANRCGRCSGDSPIPAQARKPSIYDMWMAHREDVDELARVHNTGMGPDGARPPQKASL